MELWDYEVDASLFRRVGSRAFRQCEATDTIRCGGAAMRGMTWQGRTEGQHSALLCDHHTLMYLSPMIPELRGEDGAR